MIIPAGAVAAGIEQSRVAATAICSATGTFTRLAEVKTMRPSFVCAHSAISC